MSVIMFLCVVFLGVILWQSFHAWSVAQNQIGDGRTLDSYRFDLTNLSVDKEVLTPARLPRDGMPAILSAEAPLDSNQIEKLNAKKFSIYATSSDQIVGVVINGQARAYPLRYLRWHEIINDTLADTPIVVTFSNLTNSAAVFDRRVGEETLSFAFSGIVLNHNLVMYDKREIPEEIRKDKTKSTGESLWSQLKRECIAGPLAGKKLKVLPAFFGSWGDWVKMHPDTSAMTPDPNQKKRYKRSPLTHQFYEEGKPIPHFPYTKPPSEGDNVLELFQPIIAWGTKDGWKWATSPLNEKTKIPSDAPRIRSFWFAWYAINGDAGRVK